MDDTAPMKQTYDKLGDAALKILNSLHPPQKQAQQDLHASEYAAAAISQSPSDPKPRKRDLFILLRDHAQDDEILGKLWTEAITVPNWVCWEQIERGQEVFYRYGGPALTGLAFQSLLGGMVQ